MLGNQWLTSCCPTRSWSLAGNRGGNPVRMPLLTQLGVSSSRKEEFEGLPSQILGYTSLKIPP